MPRPNKAAQVVNLGLELLKNPELTVSDRAALVNTLLKFEMKKKSTKPAVRKSPAEGLALARKQLGMEEHGSR